MSNVQHEASEVYTKLSKLLKGDQRRSIDGEQSNAARTTASNVTVKNATMEPTK